MHFIIAQYGCIIGFAEIYSLSSFLQLPEVNNIPCWPQLTQINLSSHHDILSIFPSPKVRCSPSKKDPFARLSKLI